MARSFALLTASLAALAFCGFAAAPALAATTNVHLDPATFEADCKLAGGIYGTTTNGKASCGAANCDGAGGKCVVICDAEACVAETPHAVSASLPLHNLLRDGKRLRPAPVFSNDFWGDPNEHTFEIH